MYLECELKNDVKCTTCEKIIGKSPHIIHIGIICNDCLIEMQKKKNDV